MAKLLVVFVFIAAVCNLEVASAKTLKMTAVDYDVGRPTETACHGSDISFQTASNVDGMYVGVPQALFANGINCGKKITVSCRGRKPNCQNQNTITLTIVDTLEGDFINISHKAFSTLSDFDIGIIDVNITIHF